MLQVAYFNRHNELLVNGYRQDYEQLASLIQQLFKLAERQEIALKVASIEGGSHIQYFVIRKGVVPNCVFYETGQIIFLIAPTLVEQFLSFIQFPTDEDLLNSPIQYHHHYDAAGSDGIYINPDSLSVVFALTSNYEPAA